MIILLLQQQQTSYKAFCNTYHERLGGLGGHDCGSCTPTQTLVGCCGRGQR